MEGAASVDRLLKRIPRQSEQDNGDDGQRHEPSGDPPAGALEGARGSINGLAAHLSHDGSALLLIGLGNHDLESAGRHRHAGERAPEAIRLHEGADAGGPETSGHEVGFELGVVCRHGCQPDSFLHRLDDTAAAKQWGRANRFRVRQNWGMPTNVSPEFKKAQTAFRRAREPDERLALLKEMLRLIPKHKGTEHLQSDIKSKIKDLTDELQGPKKSGGRSGPPTSFRPEGAAQIALVGPPNSGKSALHARLTGSHSTSQPYPFATQFPHPGMFPHEDAAFQLIDLPSISSQHPIPWIANTLQTAEGALLVVDLSQPGTVERLMEVCELLAAKRVYFHATWPRDGAIQVSDDDEDMFATRIPTLLVANKSDLLTDPEGELEVLEELSGVDFPTLAVSAETGDGLDNLGEWLFEHLGVVRVYTKIPGEPPDRSKPFTIRHGDTVLSVAEQVHRDVARDLKFARVWGAESFEGQQVGRDHALIDGDVIELHV